jgi:hypothetical protein
MDSREILRRLPPSDMEFIIQEFLSEHNEPELYREVYELYILKDMSVSEIARQLDRTHTAITNRIRRLVSLVLREPILPGQLFTDTKLLSISVDRLPLSERTLSCLRKKMFSLSAISSSVASMSSVGS